MRRSCARTLPVRPPVELHWEASWPPPCRRRAPAPPTATRLLLRPLRGSQSRPSRPPPPTAVATPRRGLRRTRRSEEHTSELQSRGHLVCRLLLEKKKKIQSRRHYVEMRACGHLNRAT